MTLLCIMRWERKGEELRVGREEEGNSIVYNEVGKERLGTQSRRFEEEIISSMLLVLLKVAICQAQCIEVGSFFLMLWPDSPPLGRIISDVNGMSVTQFLARYPHSYLHIRWISDTPNACI